MVSQSFFRTWKLALACVSFLNLVLVAAFYGSSSSSNAYEFQLGWLDVSLIVLAVLLFIASCWAVGGQSLMHHYLRAFFMFGLSVFLLYITLQTVHVQVEFSEFPFDCSGYNSLCPLLWAMVFTGIFLGFFILIDVALTLHAESNGSTSGLDQGQSNVVVLSPTPQGQSQPGYYPSQQYYSPQPVPMQQQQYQQQQYYPQQPTLVQQQQQPSPMLSLQQQPSPMLSQH